MSPGVGVFLDVGCCGQSTVGHQICPNLVVPLAYLKSSHNASVQTDSLSSLCRSNTQQIRRLQRSKETTNHVQGHSGVLAAADSAHVDEHERRSGLNRTGPWSVT